jgi:hypothetical protein
MINNDPTIKVIGFAVGVFLDAFVARLTLVPAVMAIANYQFWYHPQWFAKYVPDPDIEGERLEQRLHAGRDSADAAEITWLSRQLANVITSGRHRDTDERNHRTRGHGRHHQPHPDGAPRPAHNGNLERLPCGDVSI